MPTSSIDTKKPSVDPTTRIAHARCEKRADIQRRELSIVVQKSVDPAKEVTPSQITSSQVTRPQAIGCRYLPELDLQESIFPWSVVELGVVQEQAAETVLILLSQRIERRGHQTDVGSNVQIV